MGHHPIQTQSGFRAIGGIGGENGSGPRDTGKGGRGLILSGFPVAGSREEGAGSGDPDTGNTDSQS